MNRASALLPLGFLLGAAAIASVAWPLATYTLTLALFGVAHVLSELRYVDLRFGRRLSSALGVGLGAALLGIVGVRLGLIADLFAQASAVLVELGLGLGLVALVLPTLYRGRPLAAAVGTAVAGVMAVAIVTCAPLALLLIAVLHNFTPLAFILEATRGPARRRISWGLVLVFAVVPVAIASGQVWAVLHGFGITAPEATPLGYGPLQDAMVAYLPQALVASATALHLFCACVFLQCAHYIAVLLVLPALLGPNATGRLRWPSPRLWLILLAATGLAIIPFASDFATARRGYGVLAAVHAWVELPILLLAIGALTPAAGRSQTKHRSSAN